MRGGEVLRNPSNGQLARAAGLGTGAVPRKTSDVVVVVVGAGPAGLAASVYGASEGLATAVIDGMAVGPEPHEAARRGIERDGGDAAALAVARPMPDMPPKMTTR
jgi:thioredoxin reductase (NADPH)